MTRLRFEVCVIPIALLLICGSSLEVAAAPPASQTTTGWSRACKECRDKCDADYPKGGGPLITCRKLCKLGGSCKSAVQSTTPGTTTTGPYTAAPGAKTQ